MTSGKGPREKGPWFVNQMSQVQTFMASFMYVRNSLPL